VNRYSVGFEFTQLYALLNAYKVAAGEVVKASSSSIR